MEIYLYIADDNPDVALRTVEGIVNKAELLSEFPLLGYRYPEKTDRHYRIL